MITSNTKAEQKVGKIRMIMILTRCDRPIESNSQFDYSGFSPIRDLEIKLKVTPRKNHNYVIDADRMILPHIID